jgi:hypothetical protein
VRPRSPTPARRGACKGSAQEPKREQNGGARSDAVRHKRPGAGTSERRRSASAEVQEIAAPGRKASDDDLRYSAHNQTSPAPSRQGRGRNEEDSAGVDRERSDVPHRDPDVRCDGWPHESGAGAAVEHVPGGRCFCRRQLSDCGQLRSSQKGAPVITGFTRRSIPDGSPGQTQR